MKAKTVILASLLLGLFISSVFACWDKKPVFRWTQLLRYDTRQSNNQLYTQRLLATFNYLGKGEKPLWKVIPFFEIRRNINKDLWEREELGIEIGKDIFPWLYLGEGIQAVWLKEPYREIPIGKSRDSTESETKLVFSHNLISNKHISLKGYLLDEYTYDFDRGEGTRNELAMGLTTPIGKHIETNINWRHIDRIHDFDSDAIEASVTLVF